MPGVAKRAGAGHFYMRAGNTGGGHLSTVRGRKVDMDRPVLAMIDPEETGDFRAHLIAAHADPWPDRGIDVGWA